MSLVELTESRPAMMDIKHLLRAKAQGRSIVSLGFDHADIGERIPMYEHEITVLSYVDDGLLYPALLQVRGVCNSFSAPLEMILEDLADLGLVKEENGVYALTRRARQCTYTVAIDVPSSQDGPALASPFRR